MDPKYSLGQNVKIIPLTDSYGRPDPRVTEWVGKTGEIVNHYYASLSEVWEKTLKPLDTYCYDIRLDDGDIVRGIPEVGLDPNTQARVRIYAIAQIRYYADTIFPTSLSLSTPFTS